MFIESHYKQLILGCWGSLIVHKATLNTHKTITHRVRNKQTSPVLIGPDVFPRVQLIILLYILTCNSSHNNETSNTNKISCTALSAVVPYVLAYFYLHWLCRGYLDPEPRCNINCRQKENTAVNHPEITVNNVLAHIKHFHFFRNYCTLKTHLFLWILDYR